MVVGVKHSKSVKTDKNKEKPSRKVSIKSHTISEANVNIGYTGMDMKRELQISFGKIEAAEASVQVCTFDHFSLVLYFYITDCRNKSSLCRRLAIRSLRTGLINSSGRVMRLTVNCSK